MPTILIVGATRGLGASLVQLYAKDANNYVFGTARSSDPPTGGELYNPTQHCLDLTANR